MKISAIEGDFKSCEHYSSKAKEALQKIQAENTDIPPVFIENIPDPLYKLEDLKATEAGKHFLQLRQSLIELLLSTSSLIEVEPSNLEDKILEIDIALYTLCQLYSKNKTFPTNEFSSFLDTIEPLLMRHGLILDNFHIEHFLQNKKTNHENLLKYLTLIFKTISAQIKYQIPVCANSLLYSDMCLSKEVHNDELHWLKLPEKQLKHWLQSLEERRQAGISPAGTWTGLGHLEKLNNYFWSQTMSQYIQESNPPHALPPVSDYLLSHLIPKETCDQFFPPHKSPLGISKNSDTYDSSPLSELKIKPDDFLFGEEFESRKLDTPIELHGSERADHFDKALRSWRKELKSNCYRHSIKDYDISEEKSPSGDVIKLKCRIGEWKTTIFPDLGYVPILELTASPYALNQTFKIEGRKCTAYECFDRFIHPIIRDTGYQRISGHKHMDIRHSLQGNKELLFRLLVDFENNPWLLNIINRAPLGMDLGNDIDPYLIEKGDMQRKKLETMVEAVNKKLGEGPERRTYNGFDSICEFKDFLFSLGLWDEKYCTSNLMHIHNIDSDDPAIDTEPSSTVEFRMFHCPASGEESRLINELLIKRIQYLAKCQTENRPITYEARKPDDFSHEESVEAFLRYIEETGEPAAKYRTLVNIPIPDNCKEAFFKYDKES